MNYPSGKRSYRIDDIERKVTMDPALLTFLIFAILCLFLLSGLPLAFSLCADAAIFILWRLGHKTLYIVSATAFSGWPSFLLVAVPMFILMANFLEASGIAEDLYDTMYKWTGGLRGGLAIGTTIICAIFAALTGMSGVATVTMGLIALPSMLSRNYDKYLAVGSIACAGTLAILIPPSIIMILYGSFTGVSVGKLFIGGIIPGILLTILIVSYIAIRSYLNPVLAPAVPIEERASWAQKFKSLKTIWVPLIIIIVVLGVIYTGICTPTEASAIGSFSSFLFLLMRKGFKWKMIIDSMKKTVLITCMVMWIILGAKLFSHVYYAIGAPDVIIALLSGLELNRWGIMIIMQLIMIVLGCFIDPMGILVITTPIFIPIVKDLGFSILWFGILFTINMEIGYITPPFGFNLFYMKAVVPPEITLGDIYRSIVPFVFVDIVALGLVMIFPQLALWLPYTIK